MWATVRTWNLANLVNLNFTVNLATVVSWKSWPQYFAAPPMEVGSVFPPLVCELALCLALMGKMQQMCFWSDSVWDPAGM